MQGRKQYQEKLFTSFRLSDRIPENNFYRRLHNLLDLNFLYKTTAKYYGKEGNPGIDPVVFFKLLLTGYFQNLQSDRAIIENARLRMDILFFIGYDIDEELPWHSTLSRTRQLYGEEVFQKLFKEVLEQCIAKGMVAGRRQAIDSVMIKANASMESIQRREILNDGIQYISDLEWDKPNQKIGSPKIKDKMKYNDVCYSPSDPDARVSVKRGKPRQFNYLGQLSVDTASHVITGVEAHYADKRDSECFSEILSQTIENLRDNGLIVKEVMADTNYSSVDALKAAKDNNVDAYIPNIGNYKTDRDGFTYYQVGDYYLCSQGKELTFRSLRNSRGKNQMKDYRSFTKDCKDCPIKNKCIGKKGYKTISHSSEKLLYDEMNKKMYSNYGIKMRRLRQSTVEPVIGTLVNFLSVKKIRTIGIKQANKHFIGAAIAYNIKKWIRFQSKNPKIIAIALPIPEKIKLQPLLSISFQQNDFLLRHYNDRKQN
jgi:transposase